ncbi:MAG: hypothetical protein FIA89_02260 [Geobacter sp.]|nr:hypothetical protein [Geobacter sp.]
MRLFVCISFFFHCFFMESAEVPSAYAKPHHIYLSGIVQSFGGNQISLEAGSYILSKDVTVIRLENHGNGVHYQRQGTLSDVRPGSKVYIKVLGRKVLQIEVER